MQDNTAPFFVSQAAARRFLVRSFALDGFQTLPTVMEAVRRLEFVQEDSINVCGRIHDLVLWARVANCKPADLHTVLYGANRDAFEYYFPNLSVLPMEDYPYFVRGMQARANGVGRWHGLTDEEKPVAEKLMAHLDEYGPLRTRHADKSDGHTVSGWGTRQAVASRVMEKLWLHGHLMVARRENFERWFDRTSRLHPPALNFALPDEADQAAHLALKRLRARRFFRLPGPKDLAAIGGKDALVRVFVEGDKKPWYVLSHDADALQNAEAKAQAGKGDAKTVHLLAPLDPLVYVRDRLKSVWNFDYIWEVYTPQTKRRWGYYVLPILYGDDLVGRVDPKIDRKTGVLHLHSLKLEPPHAQKAGQIAGPLAARLLSFARFLGASRIDLNIDLNAVEPPALRGYLSAFF